MAKCLLVNPQIVTSTWNAPFRDTDDITIRHSLAQLSAVLRAHGHETSLCDFRLISGWDDYRAQVARERPDILLVTLHTCERNAGFECIRIAREASPQTKILFGGIEPTMHPDDFLEAGADFVLKGEGEITLPKLIESGIPSGEATWGEPPALDELPFEHRDLWPDYAERVQHQILGFNAPTPVVDMIAQRGCPWQCKFCCGPGEQNLYTRKANRERANGNGNGNGDGNGNGNGKGDDRRLFYFRGRSAESLCEELDVLHKRFSFRSIVFHDDQFVVNPKWVASFIDEMHRRGFPQKGIKFWAAVRADVICRHGEPGGLIEGLRDAGLQMISIGYESFSDRMLQWMKKGTTSQDNERSAEICKGLGIDLFANFILGMPFEDGRWHLEDDMKTLEAINRIRPKIASGSFFSPIPGSPFYEHYKKELEGIAPEKIGTRFPSDGQLFGVDYPRLEGLMEDYLRPWSSEPWARYAFKKMLRRMGVFEPARQAYWSVFRPKTIAPVSGKKL